MAQAAVYWCGDVQFEAKAVGGDDGSAITAASQKALDLAASLLGVNTQALATALCCQVREIPGGETVTTPNDPTQARDLRAPARFPVHAPFRGHS